MYNINVFDEAYFFFVTVAMITENVTFPVSVTTTEWKKILSSKSCSLSIQTIPKK